MKSTFRDSASENNVKKFNGFNSNSMGGSNFCPAVAVKYSLNVALNSA